LPKDILPNGHFAERTVWRTDNLPKIEISSELKGFTYTVKVSVIKLKSLSILMTGTLIVKYSQVFDKFTEISRYIKEKHHSTSSWMRFPWELWMYSMILEVKFAYVVVFIYACLFTTWRQNTFLTNESSGAQTSYQ
jgi:hypothetical protein